MILLPMTGRVAIVREACSPVVREELEFLFAQNGDKNHTELLPYLRTNETDQTSD